MTHLKTNPLADFNSPKRLFRLWKQLSGEDLDPVKDEKKTKGVDST